MEASCRQRERVRQESRWNRLSQRRRGESEEGVRGECTKHSYRPFRVICANGSHGSLEQCDESARDPPFYRQRWDRVPRKYVGTFKAIFLEAPSSRYKNFQPCNFRAYSVTVIQRYNRQYVCLSILIQRSLFFFFFFFVFIILHPLAWITDDLELNLARKSISFSFLILSVIQGTTCAQLMSFSALDDNMFHC